mmetsp:Transcript_33236/g.83871  ORF Transcript_33236/g.83871 Transcript_33236/m.83871 type:complete len:215 (-) Transcript_33236:422-1066(-)
MSPMVLLDRFSVWSDTGSPHASFQAPSAVRLLRLRSSASSLVQLGSTSAMAIPASLPHCMLPRLSDRSCVQRGRAFASREMPSLPMTLRETSRCVSPSNPGSTLARSPAPSGPIPASESTSCLRLDGSWRTSRLVPSSPKRLLLSTRVSSRSQSLSTSASLMAPSTRIELHDKSRCLSCWHEGRDVAMRLKPSEVAARLRRVRDDMSGRATASC